MIKLQKLSQSELDERINSGTKDLSNLDLSGLNFSYRDLCSVDFTNSNLSNANLSYSNLSNAIFRSANLSNADFGLSKIENADFFEADVSNVDFDGCNTRSAKWISGLGALNERIK